MKGNTSTGEESHRRARSFEEEEEAVPVQQSSPVRVSIGSTNSYCNACSCSKERHRPGPILMPAQNTNMDLESVTRQLQASTMNNGPAGAPLSPAAIASVAVLKTHQDDHDAIFEAFRVERRALEDKYSALFAPLQVKRSAELTKNAIPAFWLGAFSHCAEVAENVTDKDAIALAFMKDLRVEEVSAAAAEASAAAAEGGGEEAEVLTVGSYTLTFSFAENPFFENEELTKAYVMEDEDDGGLDHAVGCKINWKAGKDLTQRLLKKKIRGGAGGNGKVITKKEPCDSFFNFFSPTTPPPVGETEMDEDEIDMLEDLISGDFDLGETFRNDIIPRAVSYYLDEIENEDEDDEDDDEDDEDPEGEADGPGAPTLPIMPPAQNPEDCKQQ